MWLTAHIALWIFGALFAPPPPPEGGIRVIVHQSVATGEIDRNRVIDIFTLNRQNWDDGSKIYVTDFKGLLDVKNRFYEALAMKPSEIQKIWLKKQFSGKAIPPTTYATEDEVIKRVLSTPGAVGYVSTGDLPAGVKVIARFN